MIYLVLLVMMMVVTMQNKIIVPIFEQITIRWQWLHRLDAVIKHSQIFERNHHQRRFFVNHSIRG